jgi:hypothetical protein
MASERGDLLRLLIQMSEMEVIDGIIWLCFPGGGASKQS